MCTVVINPLIGLPLYILNLVLYKTGRFNPHNTTECKFLAGLYGFDDGLK
jgi:hypothetical protein